MKLIANPAGSYSAVIKTRTGRRSIGLHCKTLEEAKTRSTELNLEKIEQLEINSVISRDLIQKLTTHGGISVDEAILRWYAWMQATYESKITTHNYLSTAKSWARDTKAELVPVNEVTEADIERWVNKNDGCKGSTRRTRLHVLSSLFKFCAVKGYTHANMASLVKVKYKDLSHDQKEARVKRLFTDEEYRKVLFAIEAEISRLESQVGSAPVRFLVAYRFWYAAVIIGRHTALRISDIASLEWASINEGRLVVHTDKKNVRVDLEITPEIQQAIDGIHKLSDKWCFPQQNAINSDPSTRCQLPVQFGRILKNAGVSKHHFHELRITKVTEMNRSGSTIEEIAQFAGHSSTKSTEGYIINE